MISYYSSGDGGTRTRVTGPPDEWNGLALPVIPVRFHRQLKAGASKLVQDTEIALIDNLNSRPIKMAVLVTLNSQRPAAIVTGDYSYAVAEI